MRRTLLLFLVVFLAGPIRAQGAERPSNVILMIADGFGPASATMTRRAVGRPLALDAILSGSVGTWSTSGEISDSAADATAFACGIKTYDGAIGVDTLRAPCRTILEAAENRRMATGLVTTSRLTHATPASFAAHVPSRGMEEEIATQMMEQEIDVIFGGGRREFLPEAEGGARSDGANLLAGFLVAVNRNEMLTLEITPALAFFADSHMAYEIDRDGTSEPSLAEMTRKAIELLRDSNDGRERGFFLMIEGGRIDHAAHDNDPAGHLHDILAYDAAVAVALEYALEDGKTLVVSTADHETGGLALGRDGVYDWNPAYLMSVESSFEAMGERVLSGEPVLDVVRDGAGADDLTPEEISGLEAALANRDENLLNETLRDIVSTRAGIGWTTGGHTAVDVGLYSAGPGNERFRGHLENDEVGKRLFEVLGF